MYLLDKKKSYFDSSEQINVWLSNNSYLYTIPTQRISIATL